MMVNRGVHPVNDHESVRAAPCGVREHDLYESRETQAMRGEGFDNRRPDHVFKPMQLAAAGAESKAWDYERGHSIERDVVISARTRRSRAQTVLLSRTVLIRRQSWR